MIQIPAPLLALITADAEAAYPKECCGLLAGQDNGSDGNGGGDVRVTRVEPSPNLAEGDQLDSFLVDPKIQFDLMRDLGDGPERIIGHYHSHPDHPARPSERDRQSVFYPDHIWVIVGVEKGRAGDVMAYVFDGDDNGGGDFREISLNQ